MSAVERGEPLAKAEHLSWLARVNTNRPTLLRLLLAIFDVSSERRPKKKHDFRDTCNRKPPVHADRPA